MRTSQPLAIVIRISNVALSQPDLNAALGLQVDRYESSSERAYAQIDIVDSVDHWCAALECINSIRVVIARLVSEGVIGAPSLDIAVTISQSSLSRSWIIPADLAAAAGEAGMDIELSVYKTE
jgi:hypothetical protein